MYDEVAKGAEEIDANKLLKIFKKVFGKDGETRRNCIGEAIWLLRI